MAERGTIVNPARACPFVAFAEERDERSTVPDHRHRCYAEEVPAPRALAHQEAYCLSSSFPVCPTFQDWAKREAARAREAPAGGLGAGEGLGAGGVRGAFGAEDAGVAGGFAAGAGMAGAVAAGAASTGALPSFLEDDAPHESRRDWTAGPPWAAEEPASSPSPPPAPRPAAPAPPSGLSGSFADRLAGGREDPGAVPRGPAWQDVSSASPGEADVWEDDDDLEAEDGAAPGAVAGAAFAGRRGRWGREDRQAIDHSRSAPTADSVAPPWERPRRYEAYPALRSRRIGRAIPPLLIALVLIAVAALLLFKLPEFLGVGAPAASPTPTTSHAPGTSVQSSVPSGGASQLPTTQPGASQLTYTVQPGDTMSKIANKFGVPLQALIDANKTTVPDPNKLNVGDVLVIPAVSSTTVTQAP